ncbi:MAG: hypothetical protein HY321_08735, partial [Armatimonadetes bacterium]|nr:hypothetical protein [Armatimonadota bacterium]
MHALSGIRRRGGLLLVLVLCALPGLAHVRSGQPLEYDQDTPIILAGVDATGGLLGSWRWFVNDWPLGSHLYRPVTVVSLALDRRVWGEWAPGYRLTNWVLANLVNLLMVWLMLALTRSGLAAAFACALLSAERWGFSRATLSGTEEYAVPLVAVALFLWWQGMAARRAGKTRTTLVWEAPLVIGLAALVVLLYERRDLGTTSTWIATRTTHLGTLFSTAMIALLVVYAQRQQPKFLVLAVAACALAMASYEQAVTAPAIGSVWLALIHPHGPRAGLRASAGLWAVLVAYILVRQAVFGLQPNWYYRMQVRTRWKELWEWVEYAAPLFLDRTIWRVRPEGWLALWYRPLWLSVLGAAGYVLA